MAVTMHNGYACHIHDDVDEMVERARLTLAGVRYNTLVGTGLSGALVVPAIARALGKHWLIIRKKGDNSHSCRPSEGALGSRWVFVDDFISSGDTLRRVKYGVWRTQRYGRTGQKPFETRFVGAYLYENRRDDDAGGYIMGEFRAADSLTRYKRAELD